MEEKIAHEKKREAFPAIGQILRESVETIKTHFPMLLLTLLVIFVPYNVLLETTYARLTPAFTGDTSWLEGFVGMRRFVQISGILDVLLANIGYAMVIVLAATRKKQDFGQLIGTAIQHWPKMLLASIIYGVVTNVGFLIFVIPGLIAFVLFSLHQQAIMLEGKKAWPSLDMSLKMVKPYWWQMALYLLVVGVVVAGFGLAFGFLIGAVQLFVFDYSADVLAITVASDVLIDALSLFVLIMTTHVFLALPKPKEKANSSEA